MVQDPWKPPKDSVIPSIGTSTNTLAPSTHYYCVIAMIRLHGAYISTGYILKDKSACSTSSLTSVHVKEAINTKAVIPTSRSKRRTTAAQEERLQPALARLAQQESSSSDVKSQPQHQYPPEISVDK